MAETARPRRIALPTRGGEMAAYELGPADRPVDIVFSHANGFNARTYLSILAPVAARSRILLLDARGHGLTDLPADPEGRRDWLDVRDDLLAVLAALDLGEVVLSGHSMGATASLMAAAEAPGRVREVVLFEPVIMAPGATGEPADSPLVQGALKRRAEFPSREAALEAYTGRGPFRAWTAQMLADYVTDGVRDRADGQVELSCAPTWEFSNYVAQAHDARGALSRLRAPLRIFKAERGSTCTLDADELKALTPVWAEIATVPGTTHFLPMERPELVAQALMTGARP